MRPKPSTPSVFSYSSTPLNSERSQAPPVSEPCACGTLRASASSSASVCSAAVITFDCGAFATITPRFVAASKSTLSTPTRPTAFRRSARSSRPASSSVAERMRIPSNSPMRRSSSGWSQSVPISTSSPASRSSCTPESPIFSLTRTFTRSRVDCDARVGEHALRGRHARAQLYLVAELPQRHLERRDRHDDVEGAEVAAVGDAGDLALQLALPARDGYAEPVPHQLGDTATVDRVGKDHCGHNVGVVVRRSAEQLEVEPPGRLACGASEQRVPLEDLIETLALDHSESHVERLDESDRRGERAVRRVLSLAAHRALPVEVVAPAGDAGGALERCLVRAREAEPRRRH